MALYKSVFLIFNIDRSMRQQFMIQVYNC